MDSEELPSRKRILILCICCISILMVSLDSTIVNVALPSLQRDLHTSISGAQWTIDAYTLVLASFLLLSGSTADRIGRKRTFQVGLVVFSLGSLLCSLAPTNNWLIIFRMLQAIGGSMLNPVALSIINNTFTSAKERAKAIGAWSGVVGISIAAGPIIGGALVVSVGWRSIFWINLPIGLAALILTAKFVPESKAAKARRLDPVGQALVVGLLASLLYGIIEASRRGWGAPLIIGCFVASAACLVALILYENRRFEPLLNLRFFRSAPFSGATIIAIGAFVGLGGFLFLNTLYLQDVRGLSAIHAGLYLLPMAVAMFVVGPISGRIVARSGPRIPLTAGGVCLTLAASILALSGGTLPDSRLFTGYALIGIGLGFVNAAITNTALSGMPRSQAGVAAGTTSTSRQVGQSLGVAVIGSILAIHETHIAAGPVFVNDARICWWVLSGVGLGILITANVTTGAWALKTAEACRKEIEAEEASASMAKLAA
jgi:EmrB/QacA subfamily drug resistance transporter